MEDWYLNVLNENSPDVALTAAPFMGVDGQPVDFVTGSAWVIPTESDFPDQACEFIKTMTSSDAWIAAAEARAEAREADGLFFTGVYTGNTVADETIFGEMVQLDEGTYGPAVQAVLDAQEAAFSLPSSRRCRVPDRLAERRQPGPGRGAGAGRSAGPGADGGPGRARRGS